MIGRSVSGDLWEYYGGSWGLLVPGDLVIRDDVFKKDRGGAVLYSKATFSDFGEGTILQGADNAGLIAVKTAENTWLITGESKSGYTDTEVEKYMMDHGNGYRIRSRE